MYSTVLSDESWSHILGLEPTIYLQKHKAKI
jgi:hypothetical protein